MIAPNDVQVISLFQARQYLQAHPVDKFPDQGQITCPISLAVNDEPFIDKECYLAGSLNGNRGRCKGILALLPSEV